MSSARLTSETAGSVRGRAAGASEDAAIELTGRRADAYARSCPTCHAPAGRLCLRSLGRRGRRRDDWRRSPHLARLELATTNFSTEEGRSPGLRRSRTWPSPLDALLTASADVTDVAGAGRRQL